MWGLSVYLHVGNTCMRRFMSIKLDKPHCSDSVAFLFVFHFIINTMLFWLFIFIMECWFLICKSKNSFVCVFFTIQEKFEDTKGLMRSRKWTNNRQYNDQKNNNDLQSNTENQSSSNTNTTKTGGELSCSIRVHLSFNNNLCIQRTRYTYLSLFLRTIVIFDSSTTASSYRPLGTNILIKSIS